VAAGDARWRAAPSRERTATRDAAWHTNSVVKKIRWDTRRSFTFEKKGTQTSAIVALSLDARNRMQKTQTAN
jgi:hypothetical protein